MISKTGSLAAAMLALTGVSTVANTVKDAYLISKLRKLDRMNKILPAAVGASAVGGAAGTEAYHKYVKKDHKSNED